MNKKLLIERRKELGMRQQDLADACGLSKNTIYNYENGRVMPTRENVEILAKVLGIKENELVDNFDNIDIKEFKNNSEKELLEHINELARKSKCSDFAETILKAFKDISGFDIIYLPNLKYVILLKGDSKTFKCELGVFDYHISTFITMCRNLGKFKDKQIGDSELCKLISKEKYYK